MVRGEAVPSRHKRNKGSIGNRWQVAKRTRVAEWTCGGKWRYQSVESDGDQAEPTHLTLPSLTNILYLHTEKEKGAAQCWQKGATGKQEQKAFSPEAWEDFMLRVTVVWKAAKPGVELLMVHLLFTCAQALPEITQQQKKTKARARIPGGAASGLRTVGTEGISKF